MLLGQALWCYLSKNQNNHRDDYCGNSRPVLAVQFDEQHRGHRSSSDINQVIAYQNRGEEIVVVLLKVKNALGLLVAGIRFVLDSDSVK